MYYELTNSSLGIVGSEALSSKHKSPTSFDVGLFIIRRSARGLYLGEFPFIYDGIKAIDELIGWRDRNYGA